MVRWVHLHFTFCSSSRTLRFMCQRLFCKKNMKTIGLQPQYWVAGILLALIFALVSLAFSVATT